MCLEELPRDGDDEERSQARLDDVERGKLGGEQTDTDDGQDEERRGSVVSLAH